MKINCGSDREDHELPKWEEIPDEQLEIPPSEDPNSKRIHELENLPWVIVEDRKKKTDDLMN